MVIKKKLKKRRKIIEIVDLLNKSWVTKIETALIAINKLLNLMNMIIHIIKG